MFFCSDLSVAPRSKVRATFLGTIILALAFSVLSVSRLGADTLYRNSFDDAGSLAGMSNDGTITVSNGQFLSGDGHKSRGILDLSTIPGYETTLENNTDLVTIGFNVSVDDVNGLNGGFFLELSSTTQRASHISSNGYSFAGGGFVGDRTLLASYSQSGGSGTSYLFDIANGIPDIPSRGSVKIEYNPTNDTWTLYMRIGTEYVDPHSLTVADKVGDVVNSQYTGIPLRYLTLGASSVYDDIYFDNLTVSVGPPSATPVDNTYFDITFEEAKHVVGQAPATGGTDSPSVLVDGSTEVINFGGSKVLKFAAPVTPGTDSSNETISLTVARDVESYTLEYDLYVDNLVLPPSGVTGELFATNVRDNADQRFFFQPLSNGQNLRYFQSSPSHPNPPALSGNIGTYVHDRWYHVKIEVDTVAKTWAITIDGDLELNGPIYLDSDVDEISFRLTDRDGAGDAVVYLDNIKVTGPPPPPPPDPPTNVTATNGNHSDRVAVNWTPSAGATGYHIYRHTSDDSSGATEVGTVGAVSSFQDFSAVAGTMYYYWVTAENNEGESDFSDSNSGFRLAPPIKVTDVSATDGTSPSKVTISWTLTPYTGTYRIYRGTTSDFGSASLIRNINSQVIDTWDDTTAVSGQTYYYWVRGANSAGEGTLSDPDTGYLQLAPDPPTNVSASDGTSAAHTTIVWDLSPNTNSYRIYRSTVDDPGTSSILTATTDTFLNDTSGSPGQVYYYWIRSTNDVGDSPFSASASGFKLGPPAATIGVTATDSASFDQVTLNWDLTAQTDSYRIFRSTTANPGDAVEIGTSLTGEFVDFTAEQGETYYYWVQGENAAGTSSLGTFDTGQRSIATPDLQIGRNSIFKAGDDVYSLTGSNQRISQTSKKRRKLFYFAGLENDGSVTDTMTFAGTRGNRFFRALFRDGAGLNVTTAVITGTHQENLASDEESLVRLEVKPARSIKGRRKKQTFIMRMESTEDPSKLDTVQALAKTKKEKKKKKKKR